MLISSLKKAMFISNGMGFRTQVIRTQMAVKQNALDVTWQEFGMISA